MPHTRVYRNGALERSDFTIAEGVKCAAEPDTLVWLDLSSPNADELAELATGLDLHELAVGDAVSRNQRTKLDRYVGHLFLSAHSVGLDRDTGELTDGEVSAFVTQNVLVTVHERDRFDVEGVATRLDDTSDLASNGIAYLLHGLLDYVVDTHHQVIQAIDDTVEDLEDQLFSDDTRRHDTQRRIFELRKRLVRLRRIVLPMREVVARLTEPDLRLVPADLQPYYRSVADRAARTEEWIESLREMVATMLDTHLTMQGNRLNIIMKKLTSWAAIIAVPTAITGFYGQNVPVPGLNHPVGLYVSSLSMAILFVVLYVLFRRRDWL